jgi:hypothetical protein
LANLAPLCYLSSHGLHRRRDRAQRLPPPEKGNVRLNLLTPIGLCFGEGPFAAIARDPVGGPLVKAGAMLLHRLQQPRATVN